MKQRPYHLLLGAAVLPALASFFISTQNQTIDFHLHDTYFVVAHTYALWLLSAVSLIFWILYLLAHKIMFSKALSRAHIIITLLTVVIIIAVLFLNKHSSPGEPRRYYDYGEWNVFYQKDNYIKAMAITISILLCGQIVFIINLIAGLLKKLIRAKKNDIPPAKKNGSHT